jgi:hypothetical protein
MKIMDTSSVHKAIQAKQHVNTELFHKGWLEPLLDPIARNHNTTTVPIIEHIDPDSFGISSTSIDEFELGGFDWDLAFYWLTPSDSDEHRRRGNKTRPIRTPVMAGRACNFKLTCPAKQLQQTKYLCHF